MSYWRLTEQAAAPPQPSEDNGKKTVRVFAQDDPGSPGTTILGTKDSDGNEGDFKGPQGDQGVQGNQGNVGPAGTIPTTSAADINDPTEIELTGTAGGLARLVCEANAGTSDDATLYIYDTNGPAKNSPYVMNTSDGGTSRWIAIAGKFTTMELTSNLGSRLITAAEIAAIIANAPTKESFFSAGADTANQDNYSVRNAAASASSYFSFFVPHDFTSLVSLELIVFPTSTQIAADIDLFSSYAEIGQDRTAHQESDTTITYNLTANQMAGLDISSVFSAIVAGDFCGIHVDQSGAPVMKYLGIRLRYN